MNLKGKVIIDDALLQQIYAFINVAPVAFTEKEALIHGIRDAVKSTNELTAEKVEHEPESNTKSKTKQ